MTIGTGSYTLADYPAPTVRIECERCGRAGSYRLDGLLARFTDLVVKR